MWRTDIATLIAQSILDTVTSQMISIQYFPELHDLSSMRIESAGSKWIGSYRVLFGLREKLNVLDDFIL